MSDLEKKSYINDRWISTHPAGFHIIFPKNFNATTPLCCPLCKTLMRSKDDECAWDEFNVCHKCSLTWAAPRREKWKEGWRPDEQQVKDEMNQRPPLNIKFVIE